MQNSFGLKDFVLLVLVAVVGGLVLMGMVQEDRRWAQVKQISTRLESVEQQLARLSDRVRAGIGAAPALPSGAGQAGAVAGSSASSAPTARDTSTRDASWARPGAPIDWQKPMAFVTDPSTKPGFREGGRFTECFEARPAKIVPYIQTDVYGRRIVDLVMDTFADYDPQTLKLRGVLAEAWQMDPAGMWLRVKIRDDARFSDGQPVTAEDMRWTFHDFIMNPQIEAQRTRAIVADQIERVQAISPRVVEFTFKQRLFSNLDNALTFYVMPKHFFERFSPAEINKATGLIMGSGPYKLANLDPNDQWTPGQTVRLVRNEQYWGPRPAIAEMNFRDMSDELARLTGYKNGDMEMITPSAPQFASLQDDAEFPKNNQMLNSVTMRSGRGGIIWNCGNRNGKPTPFTDKRVRQAMTMLLDREKMVRDIWRGIGTVAKGFVNPNFEGAAPDVKAWPFDPARAKALLKEAGWEDRDGSGVLKNAKGEEFVFEFTYSTGGEIAQRVANFVRDAYGAAGIRVTLRGIDWSVGDSIRKQRDYDGILMAWGAVAPESDPKQIFHSEAIKDQGDNFAQWNSPTVDKAIDALRLETDFAKRMVHWQEFDRVMHDEQPYTWIRLQPELRIIKPDVGNARMYPKGIEPEEFFRGGPASPSVGG
jgi:peptide/nickel transport system substrate-binding protein